MTAQVSPIPRTQQDGLGKSRFLRQYLPLIGLLSLALIIAAMVGLSGPDLSNPTPKVKPLPPPTPPHASPVPEPGLTLEDPDAGAGRLSEPPLIPEAPGYPDQGGASSDLPLDGRHILGVKSTPGGAEVHLDGVFQCQSPCSVESLRADRVYLLSVRQEGHLPWSSLVDIEDRSEVQLSAYLTPTPDPGSVGYLEVTTPTRSDLYIDGKHMGHVTSEGSFPLRPGEYEVALAHPRKTRRPRHLVRIEVGKTTSLSDNF